MTPDCEPAEGGGVQEVPGAVSDEEWERLPSSRYATLSHARRRQRVAPETDQHHLLSQSGDEVDSVRTGHGRVLSRSQSERARRTRVHFDIPLRRTSSLPRHLTSIEITISDDMRSEDIQKTSTLPLKTRMEYRLVGGVTS